MAAVPAHCHSVGRRTADGIAAGGFAALRCAAHRRCAPRSDDADADARQQRTDANRVRLAIFIRLSGPVPRMTSGRCNFWTTLPRAVQIACGQTVGRGVARDIREGARGPHESQRRRDPETRGAAQHGAKFASRTCPGGGGGAGAVVVVQVAVAADPVVAPAMTDGAWEHRSTNR